MTRSPVLQLKELKSWWVCSFACSTIAVFAMYCVSYSNFFSMQVENLFYNMVARRKTLQNSNDDYPKIVDFISRFAVHHINVNFSCRKVNIDIYGNSSLLRG
jgi:hypothetical protein